VCTCTSQRTMQRTFRVNPNEWYGCMGVCLLVAVACCPRSSDTARVLAIETIAAKSHWYFMRGVLRALVDRGHQVTVYTPFPDAGTPATDGYTEVDTNDEYRTRGREAVDKEITEILIHFSRPSIIVPFLINESRSVCDIMDRILPRDLCAYDLFITEAISSECVTHVARRLAVPLIYTTPAPMQPSIETAAFGHYGNPAVVSHLFATYAVPDTFYRRLNSVAIHLYTICAHFWYTMTTERRPYDLVAPVKPALVFVNSHHSVEASRPLPGNRVDVGGVHLTALRPLPTVSTYTREVCKFFKNIYNDDVPKHFLI